jgi:protein-L-isoaspartate O-methyltransferase
LFTNGASHDIPSRLRLPNRQYSRSAFAPEAGEAEGATDSLTAFLTHAALEAGDAARGWDRHAPYDVIVLTGSTPVLPAALLAQLAPEGRLFAVVGEAPAMSARLVTCTRRGEHRSTDLFETVIRPLVNAERPSRFKF